MIDEAPQQPHGIRAADLLKAGQLTLRSERDGALHTISMQGELADDLERELIRVEGSDALSIVIDLTGLQFIDSTGVRLLLSAHARSRADSNRLTLLRGPKPVQRVFELTGILDILPFADRSAIPRCCTGRSPPTRCGGVHPAGPAQPVAVESPSPPSRVPARAGA